jgi:hypothetical protein
MAGKTNPKTFLSNLTSDFVQVKRGHNYYLVDKLGKNYKMAFDISQLDSTVKFMYPDSKNLETIPPSVFTLF